MKKAISIEDFCNWESKFTSCIYSARLLNKLFAMNQSARNKINLQLIKKAIYVAKLSHEGQTRKSGEPYISHPLAASEMLAEHCFKTNVIAATILHDTIEDTNLTYEMIHELFNPVVADHVLDVTRIILYDGIKMSAVDTIEKLVSINKSDSLIIKLFDRLHNVKTLDSMPPEKVKKIINETLDHFIVLAIYLGIQQTEQELLINCIKLLKLKPLIVKDSKSFAF